MCHTVCRGRGDTLAGRRPTFSARGAVRSEGDWLAPPTPSRIGGQEEKEPSSDCQDGARLKVRMPQEAAWEGEAGTKRRE